jgi:hypothetical protein
MQMALADEHNERLMLMVPAATFVALRWSSASSGVFAPTTCRRYSSSTSPWCSSPSPDSLAVDAKLYGRMQRAGHCAAARKRRAVAETGEMTGSDGSEMIREAGEYLSSKRFASGVRSGRHQRFLDQNQKGLAAKAPATQPCVRSISLSVKFCSSTSR